MARVTTEQARKITNSTSNGFFSLKNDNDKATVRFMYNTVADIETYAVHDVTVNGFNKHVDCLKDAEGNGVCPFCEKGVKRTARTFFKLYKVDTDTVEIWDCGIKRAPGIENILKMSRSSKLVNDVFEIVRHGKAKSTDTTYEIIYKSTDDITLDDLPNTPDLYGKYILKKTPDEMEHYITNNEFPKVGEPSSNTSEDKPVKRVNRGVF